MSDGAARLSVEDVTLSFGGIKALRGVSFTAEPGSITAVIGPNGAGKTSVFNCISGFYRPSSGRIRLDDQDLARLGPPKRAALGMARSFQNIALFRGMTVLDNIKLGRHAHMKTNLLQAFLYTGAAQREEEALRREVEERIIDFLEIDHIRNQSVATLSYGLQKRVELARALAMRPRILLLDEPVAGMTDAETEETARLLREIAATRSVVVVAHDMSFVRALGVKVTCLHEGSVLSEGTLDRVSNDPKVIEVYLGR